MRTVVIYDTHSYIPLHIVSVDCAVGRCVGVIRVGSVIYDKESLIDLMMSQRNPNHRRYYDANDLDTFVIPRPWWLIIIIITMGCGGIIGLCLSSSGKYTKDNVSVNKIV